MPHKPHLDALLAYVEAEPTTWMYSRRPQLGLYYLAQHAADAGYRVQVDNLSANDFVTERIVRLLRAHSCGILGLYVDHDNSWTLRRILPEIKGRIPDLVVLLGGPQVTADPEATLDRIPEALCGALGEGEETFVEILAMPALTPDALRCCPGLVVRTDAGLVRTAPRLPVDPLDRLSIPRRRELTVGGAYPFLPTMIAGRGCTGHCAFCYEGRAGRTGKRLRLHSAQRCIEEFVYLAEHLKQGYLCILDDTFVADARRLREFCNALIAKYHGRIKWFCEARVDTLTRFPDLLPLMVEAGLLRLQVGGESGCQSVLDAYRKGITLDQIRSAVESARTSGLLSLYVNFIIGGARETHETYSRTRDFALELLRMAPGCAAVGGSYFTPYPGTAMDEHPEEFGIRIVDREVVTGMGDKHVFCRTEELSRFQILEYGHDFQKGVADTMRELCKQLPYDVIRKQFQAYYDHDLATEWYESLTENPSLANYFHSIVGGRAKTLDDIAWRKTTAYPMRVVDLVASKDGKYLLPLSTGGVHELDELESTIMELSSGKLSLDDVVEVVSAELPGVDEASVRLSIMDRYANLSNEYLVVWKTSRRKRHKGGDPSIRSLTRHPERQSQLHKEEVVTA